MDRIEYIAARIHDHCDDGDEIATRQQLERIAHRNKTRDLLELSRRMVQMLEQDLERFDRSLPKEEAPPRIGPGGRIAQSENRDSAAPTTGPARTASSR